MKTRRFVYYLFLILIFILPLNLLAQSKEIPITTSSSEALKFFMDGRDKLLNIEYVAAAASFETAIQKDPDFAIAYLLRAQSGGGFNITRKNLDKAISLIDKVSEGEKTLIRYFQSAADGNGAKQKEFLDQLLKNFSSDKIVQATAGNYYYAISDYKTALDHFNAVSVLDKNMGFAYNMIGYCHSALNNNAEAEKAFQTYIKLNPEKGNPYDSYGEFLLKMGKYDESIAQYKKAFEKDPLNFSGSLSGIGNNYLFKGDYESARKYYQEYFNKAPGTTYKLGALFQKATSYIYEGKTESAIKTFDEYISLADKESLKASVINGTGYQGFILTETGNPTEGIKYFDKVIDLVNKSELKEADKENYLTGSMMQHFYAFTANGKLDQALAESEKCKIKIAARKNPGEEMELNSLLALYEIKKGNNAKAIEYFDKAAQDDPLNWYYKAIALKNSGDKQNALKLFEKVTKLNINRIGLALVRERAFKELKQ
jgi:tetratricopeptide (TPR) repeat protein